MRSLNFEVFLVNNGRVECNCELRKMDLLNGVGVSRGVGI